MSNKVNTPTKVPCGGFVLGEGLALGEDGKTLNVTGGGSQADDVYTIKWIINTETGETELQGDYAGALAAWQSGKSLKFVEAISFEGQEIVHYTSFTYVRSTSTSFAFSCYSGNNFVTYWLTESGITSSGAVTTVSDLSVINAGGLRLKSSGGANKVFRIIVSDTGELSTEDVT